MNYTSSILHILKQNNRLFTLMLMAFVVTAFGANDFLTATFQYRNLDLNNPIDFQIERKYNKAHRTIFPDLKYYGKLSGTEQGKEISVSRSDFDKYNVGDVITIFKHRSEDIYMTQYEIDNQKFINVFGKSVSFVFIPTILTFLLGMAAAFVLIRKCKLNISGY